MSTKWRYWRPENPASLPEEYDGAESGCYNREGKARWGRIKARQIDQVPLIPGRSWIVNNMIYVCTEVDE